jgi:TM2 domain-containing membrane protein YozV
MFEIVTPSGEHHPLPLGITTLGREDCDITLQDEQISRRHVQIQRQGDQLTLQDLSSTNGTFVNGSRVMGTCQLQPGDQIYLGTTRLYVRNSQGAAPTQVASPDQLPPGQWNQQPTHFPASPPQPPQHAPSPWPAQQPQQQEVSYPVYDRPPKQRSTAMLLEIGPGLFGLLGFGWIYSGRTGTGIIVLVVNISINLFFLLLSALTFGLSIIIALPVQIIAIIISAVTLNGYTKQRTDLFGP